MEITLEKLAEVRAFFAGDRFATENGAVIDAIGDRYAKCSLELTGTHRNALGGVMGGVSFTLADFAFAVAANWQGSATVSIHSDISFLSGVKGAKLFAEAKCVKDGKTTCHYQVEVCDDTGRLVSLVSITGCHLG